MSDKGTEEVGKPEEPEEPGSSDDELILDKEPEFYDASLDDRDEAWAACKRKGGGSDAVLSCPACFTTLCIDCQRHERFVTQYRAMFVLDCKVKENERLRLPVQTRNPTLKKSGKGKRKNGENPKGSLSDITSEAFGASGDVVYKPVCCSVCTTEVAVIDKDEVYHFFNVIPSYA